MNGMSDRTLEMGMEAGCSGRAMKDRVPVYADLVDAQTNYVQWGMTQEDQDKIPKEPRAMISVPLLDTGEISPDQQTVDLKKLPIVGTLSVDTIIDGPNAGWVDISRDGKVVIKGEVSGFLRKWADIVAKLLT
jgi:hypothetical protein